MTFAFVILRLAIMAIPFALAAGPSDIINGANDVGNNLTDIITGNAGGVSVSGDELGGVVASIAAQMLPFVNVAAILVIVVTGMTLILSQDENQLDTARKVLIASGSALVILNIAVPVRNAIVAAFTDTTTAQVGANLFAVQILGIIDWLLIPITVIAVLAIIISGTRAILSFGSEEGTTRLRQTVLSVAFGIFLILGRYVITASFAPTAADATGDVNAGLNATPFVMAIVRGINYFLGFIGLAAIAMIVYAAILMMANVGNEEQFNRGKSLIMRVLIGLVVIIVSAGVINLVLTVGN